LFKTVCGAGLLSSSCDLAQPEKASAKSQFLTAFYPCVPLSEWPSNGAVSQSHAAVIRVYEAANVIETHEHEGDFKA
jgi:hypothetical protein